MDESHNLSLFPWVSDVSLWVSSEVKYDFAGRKSIPKVSIQSFRQGMRFLPNLHSHRHIWSSQKPPWLFLSYSASLKCMSSPSADSWISTHTVSLKKSPGYRYQFCSYWGPCSSLRHIHYESFASLALLEQLHTFHVVKIGHTCKIVLGRPPDQLPHILRTLTQKKPECFTANLSHGKEKRQNSSQLHIWKKVLRYASGDASWRTFLLTLRMVRSSLSGK